MLKPKIISNTKNRKRSFATQRSFAHTMWQGNMEIRSQLIAASISMNALGINQGTSGNLSSRNLELREDFSSHHLVSRTRALPLWTLRL